MKYAFKKNICLKVYIDGSDNIGWSIDNDRSRIVDFCCGNKNIKIVDNWRKSNIIHNIWWNNIFNTLPEFLNNKSGIGIKKFKLLVTCSNFVDPAAQEFNSIDCFNKITKIADGWICPSTKQKKILDVLGLKTYYFPFSVDLQLFKRDKNIMIKDICNMFSINHEVLKDKIVIGSFQRDSLGTDLLKPKWQKDPGLLMYLLLNLPRDRFVLLLAGPRRHYILNECRKNNLPYIYIGNETIADDLYENTIHISKMPYLYALTDIYLITSKSEGGPKAAIEATAMKTFIMSTDVGLSSDFIDKKFVFVDQKKYLESLANIVERFKYFKNEYEKVINDNYIRCIENINTNTMKRRLDTIYEGVIKI